MNQLHIHEVLRMMQETQKSYLNKTDFMADIQQRFGAETHFYACSDSDMDASAAFDFLIRKGKIGINPQEAIAIDPQMTLCDDEHPHEHEENN